MFADPSSGTGSTFVSWFTYDTVIGGAERQRWYTAQGPVVTGQPNAALTIYQNTGGNFNAPPVTNAQAVGTATLSFDTCSSGQLSYKFTDGTGRTGTIPLTRLTQNVTCSTDDPVSRPMRTSLFPGTGTGRCNVRARDSRPRSTRFRRVLRGLVHVYAERRRRRGGRTTVVYRARRLYAGPAVDSGDDLRDHRRDVRHPDASWPENRGGGDRDDGIPELFGRDVQLQLHRREQQRPVRNHRLEPRRPGAPGMRVRVSSVLRLINSNHCRALLSQVKVNRDSEGTMAGRPKAQIKLSETEREQLEYGTGAHDGEGGWRCARGSCWRVRPGWRTRTCRRSTRLHTATVIEVAQSLCAVAARWFAGCAGPRTSAHDR